MSHYLLMPPAALIELYNLVIVNIVDILATPLPSSDTLKNVETRKILYLCTCICMSIPQICDIIDFSSMYEIFYSGYLTNI